MWNLFIILVCFTMYCGMTSAATVVLESNPKIIYPYVTKKLVLRCSVKKDNWSRHDNRSESQGLASSEISDFQHLMSIVVTEGNRETIASVTGCDPPVIEPSFLRLVQAEGDAEKSPATDEMGYLTLTWDRPLVKDADNFTCEAYALNANKSSVSLNVTLEVTAVEPEMSDLMNYIAINDRNNEALERKIVQLEQKINNDHCEDIANITSKLETQIFLLSQHNMQTRKFRCPNSHRSKILFSKYFRKPPTMFVTIEGDTDGDDDDGKVLVLHVDTASFEVKCHPYSTNIHWLAVQ